MLRRLVEMYSNREKDIHFFPPFILYLCFNPFPYVLKNGG